MLNNVQVFLAGWFLNGRTLEQQGMVLTGPLEGDQLDYSVYLSAYFTSFLIDILYVLGDTSAEVLGDVLVICGAALYGASNVAEEFVVKTASMTEFLGMMSLFACFFSGANV